MNVEYQSSNLVHVSLCFSVDPFSRKDWFDIKAPSFFEVRNVGKTLVNRTQGLSKFSIVSL